MNGIILCGFMLYADQEGGIVYESLVVASNVFSN